MIRFGGDGGGSSGFVCMHALVLILVAGIFQPALNNASVC
jgi:hypothetical protein